MQDLRGHSAGSDLLDCSSELKKSKKWEKKSSTWERVDESWQGSDGQFTTEKEEMLEQGGW